MPEPRQCSSHLASEAVAFVVELPRRQQRIVLDFADQIARQPFQIGDYQTTDSAGRTIENLLLGDYLFSFWVDHSSCEVRVSEIVRV